MRGHYHAVIWIDHRQARIFHFNTTDVDKLVVGPENPVRHLHHKANAMGSGHGRYHVNSVGWARMILIGA